MKIALRKLIRNEQGLALPVVLVLLVFTGLILAPTLAYVSTAVKAGTSQVEKMALSYAADAGIEDALWRANNDDVVLDPYDYEAEYNYSLPQDVNSKTVNITIKQIWPLAGLESDQFGTTPPSCLLVTGGIIDLDDGKYKVQLSYDGSEGDLYVDRVAVWIPASYEYVTGSSNGITSDDPTSVDWHGGKALQWDFIPAVNFTDLPAPEPPGGGFTPGTEYPATRKLYFNISPTGNITAGSYSWVRTTNPDLYLAWDTDCTIHHIASTATNNTTGKSVTVEGYTYYTEGGGLGSGGSQIQGNYLAIGNTMMEDINHDRTRETFYNESSSTVSDIPIDAEVAFAYLYWSGSRVLVGEMEEDDKVGLKIDGQSVYFDEDGTPTVGEPDTDPETETIRPNASGTSTQCEPFGAPNNYQCVDEVSADEDFTYVRTSGGATEIDTYGLANHSQGSGNIESVKVYTRSRGTEEGHIAETVIRTHNTNYYGSSGGGGTETIRPNTSGSYTQCEPYGAPSNYQCVDETSADEDFTYVRTSGGATEIDTYGLANHSQGSGTINSVKVYTRSRGTQEGHIAETVIRTHDTNYYGSSGSGGTETLRPNASGSYTQCEPYGAPSNYQCVDETSADEDFTYVRTSGGATEIDTYGLANHSQGSGNIESVKVYTRSRGTQEGHIAETVIRTHDTNYYGGSGGGGTEILRPNASGTYTQCDRYGYGTWSNYQCVDEASADEDSTYVYTNYGTEVDTYGFANHSQGSGTINWVKVYVRSKGTNYGHAAETAIRTHSTNYYNDYTTLPTYYTDLSTTYTTNPYTGSAWTWDEIDDLQAGVRQYDTGSGYVYTTQVYIEVTYGTTSTLPTYYTDLSTTYTTNPYTGSAWTWDEIDDLQAGVRQYDTGSGYVYTTQVYIEVSYGTISTLPTYYTDLSTTYTTNPYTSSAWTWDEIDNLQAGVRQYDTGSGYVYTTQVYVEVTYEPLFQGIEASKWWLVENDSGYYSYSCFRDVTALIRLVTLTGNATYTAIGVAGDTGSELSYAGWSLILIYSSPSEENHQFFLYDTFMYATSGSSHTFTIEGFEAPMDAEASVTCFVGEGDDHYDGDYMHFNSYPLSDETNPEDDVWNGKSSGLGGELIDGVDIDSFDVSSPIIEPGDSEATVSLGTNIDCWNFIYIMLGFQSEYGGLSPNSSGIISYSYT